MTSGFLIKWISLAAIVAMNTACLAGGGNRNPLPPNPPIRVLIVQGAEQIQLVPKGGLWNFSTAKRPGFAAGKLDTTYTVSLGEDGGYSIDGLPDLLKSNSEVVLEAEVPDSGTMEIQSSPRETSRPGLYEGKLILTRNGKGLQLVSELPLESYLRGVVPAEIGAVSPPAAKRAQAVAARSEAALALLSGKYNGDGYDICSTVQCQVYLGVGKATEESDEAISATRGLILQYQGEPLSAFYSAQCAGKTDDIRHVWPARGGESAYWDTSVFDGPTTAAGDLSQEPELRKWLADETSKCWCNPATARLPAWAGRNYRWKRSFSSEQLGKWAESKIGPVRELTVLARGDSGRVTKLSIVGESGDLVINDQIEIRRWFQPALRSSMFVVDKEENQTSGTVFHLTGGGSGHGVGMCQTGAMGMAEEGKDYDEILKHYYPRASLRRLY